MYYVTRELTCFWKSTSIGESCTSSPGLNSTILRAEIDEAKAGRASVHPSRTNSRFVLSAVSLLHTISYRESVKCSINFALCHREEYSRRPFQPSKNFTVFLAKQKAYAVFRESFEEADVATP